MDMSLKLDDANIASIVQLDLQQAISYVMYVMQPLLSQAYVVLPKLVTVDEHFIADIVNHIVSQRPARRLLNVGDTVDEHSWSAFVLPDFCFIPEPHPSVSICGDGAPVTVCVEIKPKNSFILENDHRHFPEFGVCTFCMHKYLKQKCGKWSEISSYCPLDLFSGERDRMKHALESLITTPQNNLKMWADGEVIHSSDMSQDLENVLSRWFQGCGVTGCRDGSSVGRLLDMVIDVLLMPLASDSGQPFAGSARSMPSQHCTGSLFNVSPMETNGKHHQLPEGCVLERVLAAQSLDTLGIMGIYPLYQQLLWQISEHPHLRSEWGFNGDFNICWLRHEKVFNSLKVNSVDWAVEKVKQFLVSRTLQDCSVMMALLPVPDGEIDNYPPANVLRCHGVLYMVSVALVDLDPKPLHMIPTYIQKALEIRSAFWTMTSIGSCRESRVLAGGGRLCAYRHCCGVEVCQCMSVKFCCNSR